MAALKESFASGHEIADVVIDRDYVDIHLTNNDIVTYTLNTVTFKQEAGFRNQPNEIGLYRQLLDGTLFDGFVTVSINNPNQLFNCIGDLTLDEANLLGLFGNTANAKDINVCKLLQVAYYTKYCELLHRVRNQFRFSRDEGIANLIITLIENIKSHCERIKRTIS